MESGCKTVSPERLSRSAKLFDAITDVYQDEEIKHKQQSDSGAESHATLVKKAERLLRAKAERRDEQAFFLLGHLYYEEGRYTEAENVFDSIKDGDPRALYQLAVMHYDGLGTTVDQTKAVEYMKRVAHWDGPEAASIRYTALYNIGKAYLEGYGVQLSNTEAERYWLLAADEGNPRACVKAQSSLGMFYSRPETLDLKRAFFWHSEACGNGSLESQGALGIMYLYGHGIKQDLKAALQCLKEASERGNVYAQGHLAAYYYHRKLYSRAAAFAKRITKYKDIGAIASLTDCLPEYVTKGIAIALFYYARCLQLGRGVQQSKEQARHYFTKASHLNPEVCKDLQMDITYGRL